MHMLSPPPNDKKQRHFSASYVHDQMKKSDPVFDRLKKTYKSAKSPIQIYPETISIAETTRSEHVEIDAGEPPPIDESLFFENLEPLKNMEIDGLNVMSLIWNTVNIAEMKILLKMENGHIPERDGILFPDSDQKFKSIAFTWACFRGFPHLLPKLEASGADINNIYFNGASALMCATFAGKIESVQYLIRRGVNLNYINHLNGHSALHSAAAGKCTQAAEIILDNGGDINITSNFDMPPLLHYAIRLKSESVAELFMQRGANPTYKNRVGETPLHLACSVQSLKICKLLLQKPEVDVNALDAMNRTPLHHAMMTACSNIKLVELLLKHGALVNLIDKTGFSPLHVAALNEQSDCVEMLIRNGADVSATTSKGVSALNIILRKIPESFQVFRMKMDSSIRLKRPACQNREFEMRLDFASLLPSDDKPETSFINTFIQENQKDLLTHPLVSAFLYLKWERIRKFYLLNILFYTVMVIFMTAYVLTALAYKCYNSSEPNSFVINETRHMICHFFEKQVVEVEWYVWLSLACLSIPRKILSFTIYKNFQEYLWNIENILDTIVIMSVFATSFVYTGRNYDWQNYIGAFSVLCAWTNLMLMIGQLPGFGTYVAMFTHIQFEFAKLLLAYSGLLIGFTVSFCIIFVGEPSFANPLTGLIKILAMMAGELDFEGLINQPQWSENGYIVSYHPLSVSSQILFSLFVIFIVVILMNLLVGIAVHDIQGLRKYAGLSKLVRQTKLIVYTEMVECKIKLPSFLKKLKSKKTDAQVRKHLLVVRPLNPLEKRLPKDILKAAYEIAQKNSPISDNEIPDCNQPIPYIPKEKEENTENTLQSAVEKLTLQLKINTDQMHEVKDHLLETEKTLEALMLKLS